jgi:transcriptional regulator GlxA family with amidase domain
MAAPLQTPPAQVPAGAAFYPVAGGETRSYAFLVLPEFTLLAFSSALDPLRIANQVSQKPLYHWQVLSSDGGPVASSSGVSVLPDAALADLDRDTTLLVCAGNPGGADPDPHAQAAIQRHHRHGGRVGGICTGAIALARAGLLEGRRFTLHWENQPAFRERFPRLDPTPHKFEQDGRVLTCGGGAAATDLMLSIIAADHGRDFAAIVSDMCLRRVGSGEDVFQRSSVAIVLETRNPGLIALVRLMQDHIEDPLTMEDLAAQAGYSRRHIERLFQRALGQTPARFYLNLRLDHGRSLLADTDLTLAEVSVASGFADKGYFAKAFRARFGCPPSRFGHRARRG